jgi:ketosteroid isomerase-like protein
MQQLCSAFEAKLACMDLVARYALAVNRWDLNAFVSLFTEDAIWQRPSCAPMSGHAQILAFMSSLSTDRVLRHVNGAVLVEVRDSRNASGWSQTTVYEVRGRHPLPAVGTAVDMVVEYVDIFRKVDECWLFARRDTTVVFKAKGNPA